MSLTVPFLNFVKLLQTRHGSPDSFTDMCRKRWFLAALRSFFHSSPLYIPFLPPFSTIQISILPHLILSSISWFASQTSFSKFVYNTLFGILVSAILSSCAKQNNLLKLIVPITVGFKHLHKLIYWLISCHFLFHCHILDLKYTPSID